MRFNGFDEVIKNAVNGNHEALEIIIERYKDLIEKSSCISGKYDEDLKQYICIHIALNITKFKI